MGPQDTDRSHWQDVYESLVAYGAPLWGWEPKARLSPEEALVRGLRLAHEDATVLRVLPVCLARLAKRLNWSTFEGLARSQAEEAAAGFLLELTAEMTGAADLRQRATSFHPASSVTLFFPTRSSRDRELAEARTPAVARRWEEHAPRCGRCVFRPSRSPVPLQAAHLSRSKPLTPVPQADGAGGDYYGSVAMTGCQSLGSSWPPEGHRA